jgi:ABC-type branched-subunit amino acid transport system ATPase component
VIESLLVIDGLTKRFGGVIASDGVKLGVPQGELHAVIGPNGAGKTTLIGQLTGEVVPDDGRIYFAGEDITELPIHLRSQRGLARSFQITSLFKFHRARQRRARGAGACRTFLSLLARRAPRSRPARAGAGHAGARRSRRP